MFNIMLLLGGIISFITSIVGIVLLQQSTDAEIGAFAFAKFCPLVLGFLIGVCALFALFVPSMEKYRRCRKGFLAFLVIAFLLIIVCGIILVMIPFYSTQAANEDSRNINSGAGADIRVFANDYSMAIWTVCCKEIYQLVEVRDCDEPSPCADHKEPTPCACYQDAKLFRLLEFPTSECKTFESYRVPGPNGTTTPLVGPLSAGGCANNNPKQFQREWNTVFVSIVEPIGITQLAVGLILLVTSVVGLFLMRRNDRKAKRLQAEEKKRHQKAGSQTPAREDPKDNNPGGAMSKA